MVQTVHPLAGVRTRRELLNVPAARLAHELGMEVQTFYRFERGERRMYLDRAIRLAALLDCTIEQLSQEPSIDERLAAMHEGGDTSSAPAAVPDAPVDLGIPIRDDYGKTVGYHPRPAVSGAAVDTSIGSVVLNAPTAPQPQLPVDIDPELAELLRSTPSGTMTEDDEL